MNTSSHRQCISCSRILPTKAFHRRGQNYQSSCKACRSAYAKAKLLQKGEDADRVRAYGRAKQRAFRRLMHLYPELFYQLVTEEMHNEGYPDYVPYRKLKNEQEG